MVLAAGAATRMGRLKQLLPYGASTLVEHAAEQALAARPVRVVENSAWPLGMGSSIQAGMEVLLDAETVCILLADQPFVEARHLREMQKLLDGSAALAVAAEYNGALGVPALFKPELFRELQSLEPATGARGLLRRYALGYPLAEGAVDVDTPEDFALL